METLYATNKGNICTVEMIGTWDEETGYAVGNLTYTYFDEQGKEIKTESEFKNENILVIDAEVQEKLNNL